MPSRKATTVGTAETARPLVDYCLHHRERPVPRKDAAVIALATYGQYPAIAAHLRERRGPGEVARRLGRFVSRAVRHRG